MKKKDRLALLRKASYDMDSSCALSFPAVQAFVLGGIEPYLLIKLKVNNKERI